MTRAQACALADRGAGGASQVNGGSWPVTVSAFPVSTKYLFPAKNFFCTANSELRQMTGVLVRGEMYE